MKLIKNIVGLVIACAFPVQAAEYINSDFEVGSTAGWTVVGSGAIAVVNDPLNASNKVLKWDSTAADSQRLYTAASSALSTGKYELTLRFMIGSFGGAGSNYALSSVVSLLNKVDYSVSSYDLITNSGIRGYNGSGSGSGTAGPSQAISQNNWYQLTQILDLDTKTWTWSLSDITGGGGVLYEAPSPLGFFGSPASISQLHIFGGSPQGGLLYLDNVVLRDYAAVPEPSSALLIILFAPVLVGVLRRRNRLAFS